MSNIPDLSTKLLAFWGNLTSGNVLTAAGVDRPPTFAAAGAVPTFDFVGAFDRVIDPGLIGTNSSQSFELIPPASFPEIFNEDRVSALPGVNLRFFIRDIFVTFEGAGVAGAIVLVLFLPDPVAQFNLASSTWRIVVERLNPAVPITT